MSSTIEHAIQAIYSTVVDPSLWPSTLEIISQQLGGNGAHLLLLDGQVGQIRRAAFSGNSLHPTIQADATYLVDKDPWVVAQRDSIFTKLELRNNSVVTQGAELVPHSHFVRSEFYNELASLVECEDFLGATSVHHNRWAVCVTCQTGGAGRIFSPVANETIRRIAPHIRRALDLHFELAASKASEPASAYWQASGVAAFAIGRDRTIVWSNNAADRLIETGKFVRRIGMRVAFQDKSAQVALNALLGGEAGVAGHSHVAARILVAADGARATAQMATFRPFDRSLIQQINPLERSVFLAIAPLDQAGAVRRHWMSALGLLTDAERDLLISLVNGNSVDDIAKASDRSIETIRWHVRNMINKVGAQNLSDLQRTLAQMTPL